MDNTARVNIVYRIVHFLTRLFFRVYGRWELVDYYKLPKTGAVIAACNHVSYLDPEVLGSAITRECAFIARHDLWEKRWIAWLLPKLGGFPVERGKGDRAAIKKCIEALSRGLCLVIFPEGGRSDDGTLQRAEPGVALIVHKSEAPICPIAIVGTETMLPVGAKKLKRTKLKVIFGDPIFFTPDEKREDILRAIMRAIAELLTRHGIPSVAKEDETDQIPSKAVTYATPAQQEPVHPQAVE